MKNTYDCEITPADYTEGQAPDCELPDALDRLRTEKADQIARLDVPEALRCLKERRTVVIKFWESALTVEQLALLLQRYFPRALVRDIKIDGKSIFPPA